MKVYVLSKLEANDLFIKNDITDDNIESFDGLFVISINDSYKYPGYIEPHFKANHSNVMIMYFDDVENVGEHSPTNSYECIPFTSEMSDSLVEFIMANSNKGQCVVHCHAGISRSGAVGLFINDIIAKGDHAEFLFNNPRVAPNGRVYRMLVRSLYKYYSKINDK